MNYIPSVALRFPLSFQAVVGRTYNGSRVSLGFSYRVAFDANGTARDVLASWYDVARKGQRLKTDGSLTVPRMPVITYFERVYAGAKQRYSQDRLTQLLSVLDNPAYYAKLSEYLVSDRDYAILAAYPLLRPDYLLPHDPRISACAFDQFLSYAPIETLKHASPLDTFLRPNAITSGDLPLDHWGRSFEAAYYRPYPLPTYSRTDLRELLDRSVCVYVDPHGRHCPNGVHWIGDVPQYCLFHQRYT